jgi:hypothetical protein
MESFFWIITFLSFVFWCIAVASRSSADVLQYRYKDSVFSLFKKGGFNDWYFRDPDDTWERKYIDSTLLERKKILFITIPVFFFDGWHLFKVVEQFFTWCSMMACVISGTTWVYFKIYPTEDIALFSITLLFIALIAFIITTHATHKLFFDHILMKEKYVKKNK